ncbi:MAG: hypothetical protein JW788_01500 [Candidatus Omnitrophica bacterium]|nr:hypothetical protein [Candidatus Omnitrophota bacterium]
MFFMGRADTVILLIALALGYSVCYLAKKETGFLKYLGYAIGGFIMIASISIIATRIFLAIQLQGKIYSTGKQHNKIIREQSRQENIR